MNEYWLAILVVAAVVALGIWYSYGSLDRAREFWKSRAGKNVLGGILMVLGAFALWAWASSARAAELEGTWLAYGEMFVGLDHTFEHSPNCKPDQHNDKLTSNVGFRVNIWQSASRRVAVNGKYQHHSCAFNQDDLRYDAGGIEVTVKLWSR